MIHVALSQTYLPYSATWCPLLLCRLGSGKCLNKSKPSKTNARQCNARCFLHFSNSLNRVIECNGKAIMEGIVEIAQVPFKLMRSVSRQDAKRPGKKIICQTCQVVHGSLLQWFNAVVWLLSPLSLSPPLPLSPSLSLYRTPQIGG